MVSFTRRNLFKYSALTTAGLLISAAAESANATETVNLRTVTGQVRFKSRYTDAYSTLRIKNLEFFTDSAGRRCLGLVSSGKKNQFQVLNLETGQRLFAQSLALNNSVLTGGKTLTYSPKSGKLVLIQKGNIFTVNTATYAPAQWAAPSNPGSQSPIPYTACADGSGTVWYGHYPTGAINNFNCSTNVASYGIKLKSQAEYTRALESLDSNTLAVGIGSVKPSVLLVKKSSLNIISRETFPPNIGATGFVRELFAINEDSLVAFYDDVNNGSKTTLYKVSANHWFELADAATCYRSWGKRSSGWFFARGAFQELNLSNGTATQRARFAKSILNF